jgi:hypothetical protein
MGGTCADSATAAAPVCSDHVVGNTEDRNSPTRLRDEAEAALAALADDDRADPANRRLTAVNLVRLGLHHRRSGLPWALLVGPAARLVATSRGWAVTARVGRVLAGWPDR